MTRNKMSKIFNHLLRSKGVASFLILLLVLVVSAPSGQGQARTNTIETNDYVLSLPSSKWRSETELGITRHRTYFLYDDEDPVELQVRKTLVDSGVDAADVAQKRQRWDRVSIRGYATTGTHWFEGELDGVKYAYEFVTDGKVSSKHIYYLQSDARTIYRLEFTGAQAKLLELTDEIEFIARSFRPQ